MVHIKKKKKDAEDNATLEGKHGDNGLSAGNMGNKNDREFQSNSKTN